LTSSGVGLVIGTTKVEKVKTEEVLVGNMLPFEWLESPTRISKIEFSKKWPLEEIHKYFTM
jgi:hypothetical protein